jgi:predicted AlkP superfamily phosphohydrolase/phosphomutase
LERLATAAATVGLTYQRGKAILERVGLAEFIGQRLPVGAVFAASNAVDFESSKAYLRSPSELGIRLNVEGRDPEGVVPEDDYETVRTKLISLLSEVQTPDGEAVFEEVVPRDTYIHGPYAGEAVDILTVPTDFQHGLSALIGERFSEPEPWNHKRDGVIAITGNIDPEATLGEPQLFDVAPTVLATLGIEPATLMDGDSLPVVDTPAKRKYPSYEPQTQTATEDSDVTEQLSDLGYLE